MKDYIIERPEQPCLAIKGHNSVFPVRRIYCIGRNYADHALEMGHDPDREQPFFFQKNPDNINQSGEFPYPPKSGNVHYEVELVVALKSGGRNIDTQDALSHVFGYAIGLDMTRRDLQADMKKAGRPWEIAKAFEQSAPMGPLLPASQTGHLNEGMISLKVNGRMQQLGDLRQMIWKVPEIIAHLSTWYVLARGDLIMTGTPAGVGAVEPGDVMTASVSGLGEIEVVVI